MSSPRPQPRSCDYCKAPLPLGWWGQGAKAEQEEGPLYCCLGCQIAASIVQERGEAGAARSMLTRLGLSIFFTMHVMAFTMALWTTDVFEAAEASSQLRSTLHGLFRYLVLLFSLPVLGLLGIPIFLNGWRALRRGVLSTDALLATGVGAAFAYSLMSVFRGDGPVYFEVGCVILVMMTLGRWLEATGRLKATSALDELARLLPATVRRIVGDEETSVPLDDVAVGDRLRILPGERFPADGQVVRNAALVDEQVLTGESRPVLKEPGSPILGGTLNLDGDLVVKVSAVGAEGALARLVELVKRARETKGRYQRLADRIAAWFFPCVATVAIMAFGIHWARGSLEQGLMAGLAVALIACPCALGLATPLAVWSAIGQAAGHQVLFRGGETLERLAEIRAVRFDKTGTLTTGRPEVEEFLSENDVERTLTLEYAAALAGSSPHALSHAIVTFATASNAGVEAQRTENVRVIPGRGVVGELAGPRTTVLLGSPRLMEESGLQYGPKVKSALESFRSRGLTLCMVGWDDETRGLFVFAEQWRPDLESVVRSLKSSGLDVGILTGDHAARGRSIARELGVEVDAELLPDQKVAAIELARQRFGPVAMVGDGVNDAPALAASDVGIALGCGTDVSRDSASICLLGDDLTRIPWSIDLARRTVRVIRQNLFWAFGYNTVGVIMAALGWLNPALAAFLMVASSAAVIANSLRLRQPITPVPSVEHSLGSTDSAEEETSVTPTPLVLETAPR